MSHYHIINILKLDEAFKAEYTPVVDQFYSEVDLNGEKIACFNNNTPTDNTKYYHKFLMVIMQNELFLAKDFVFFIPEEGPNLTVDTFNMKAFFKMNSHSHVPRRTCNQALTVIFDKNIPFHYTKGNEYLIPMFGFFDGNQQNIPNRIKQHDVYGYFYVCDQAGFDNFKKVEKGGVYEFDFGDNPTLDGDGGYWYNQSLLQQFVE